MPRKPKRWGPAAQRPGFAAISRLVGREPLLAEAAGVEADLGRLCARLADLTGTGPEAPRWRQAARLSREVAEGLSDLAAAVADPPHHPKPTRVRVATLHGDDLAAAAARIAQARGTVAAPAAPVPPPSDLQPVWALEGRAVAAPLSRLFALCPTPPVMALWRAMATRRRLLETLAGNPGNGAAMWPDPPARPPRPPRPVAAAARGAAPAGNGTRTSGTPAPGAEWTAEGCVERLNRARRCGTARTQDGRSVFFAARAVCGGLAALHAGDPVTLRLRRGTLGLSAVRVTPQPGPNAGTTPPPARGPDATV
jgi:cold shock CspA family protein